MKDNPEILRAYCEKYIPVLRMIREDEELTQACLDHNLFVMEKKHRSVIRYLQMELIREAMEKNLFPKERAELLQGTGVEEWIAAPVKEELMKLDADQLISCIAWHFSRDPLSFMDFIRDTIGNGYLLRMLEVLLRKLKEESAV